MTEILRDKRLKKEFLNLFLHFLIYFLIFVSTIVLYIVLKPRLREFKIRNIWWRNDEKGVKPQDLAHFLLLVSLSIVAIKFLISKRIKTSYKITILLSIGYVLKLGYALYTPVGHRQHDVWGDSSWDYGHEGYAWTFYSTGKFPTTNEGQFYHPPLNAVMQAGFMKLFNQITSFVQKIDANFSISSYLDGKPGYIDDYRYYLYSSCNVLSVMYSFIASFVMVKTLILMGIKGRGLALSSAIVILFPRLIIFAGALNNDPLAFTLCIIALYYSVKWWKNGKKWGNMLLIAIFIGLATSTKLNSAIICIPIAFVFIYEFIRSCGKKENALPVKTIILQFVAFLVICVPLVFWHTVFAYKKYGQKFGYVWGESGLNPALETGAHSFFQRFILCTDKEQYIGSVWAKPFNFHYNVLNFAIRTALMGEYEYLNFECLAVNAIAFSFLFLILFLVTTIYSAISFGRKDFKEKSQKSRENVADFIFVCILAFSQILAFIYFNIKMPYACTMDFRYIMPLILVFAIGVGKFENRYSASGNKVGKVMSSITFSLAIITLVATSSLYFLFA